VIKNVIKKKNNIRQVIHFTQMSQQRNPINQINPPALDLEIPSLVCPSQEIGCTPKTVCQTGTKEKDG
jgi:hypothetical protein